MAKRKQRALRAPEHSKSAQAQPERDRPESTAVRPARGSRGDRGGSTVVGGARRQGRLEESVSGWWPAWVKQGASFVLTLGVGAWLGTGPAWMAPLQAKMPCIGPVRCQAVVDAEQVRAVAANIDQGELEKRLGVRATRVDPKVVRVPLEGEDRLVDVREVDYVLPRAVVQAWVAKDSKLVVAYTLLLRGADPVADVPWGRGTITLGSTTLDTALGNSNATMGVVNRIHAAAGVHALTYLEATSTNAAMSFVSYAAGSSDAVQAYPAPDTQLAIRHLEQRASTLKTVAAPLALNDYEPSETYMTASLADRKSLAVNTIAVTAPGYGLTPQMYSPHRQTVGQLVTDPPPTEAGHA